MVEFMSHLPHKNLIQVLGCCVENDEQILVCELAENGNLCQMLHRTSFNWETRAAVCIGTARGLCYLHEEIVPRIIHCDVKPDNILLDADFTAKLADFDLIDFVEPSEIDSFPNSTVKGTLAYMDPEYVVKGRLTQKVDVYSFGLVMLEIITGRKPVDFALEEMDDRWILSWVMRMTREHGILTIVDPNLTDFCKNQVERFINVALLCTQANSEERPSMFQVVHMLYGGHKSDQEISEMTQLGPWFHDNTAHTSNAESMSMTCSLTISSSGKEDISDGSTSARTKDDDDSALKLAETSFASSSKEGDSVRAYFERSMEKIMRIKVERHNATNRTRTREVSKFSEHVSMEVIYPPFQSGEYPPPSRSES